MRCPKCKSKAVASATRFIEYSNSQRRIRTCKCGFKFTTYERIESVDDLDGRTYLDTPKPKV